jgi:hypothetical protein
MILFIYQLRAPENKAKVGEVPVNVTHGNNAIWWRYRCA